MVPIEHQENSPEFTQAVKFVNSGRGQYIISQALFIASMQLKKVELPHREVSNIKDMEFLLVELFPLYAQVLEDAVAEEDMEPEPKEDFGHFGEMGTNEE